MLKFKIGDRVRILDGSKIKSKSQISWTESTDGFIGNIFIVDALVGDGGISLDNEPDYYWDENWLELAEPEPESKKGFEPESLTFDGVKIEEGDEVNIWGQPKTFTVCKSQDKSEIIFINYKSDKIPLGCFNVLDHFPKAKKDEELKKLENEFHVKEKILKDWITLSLNDEQLDLVVDNHDKAIDNYYQARKTLENYGQSKKN